ncbi:hypothetical protein [Aquella oligotrophica]|uniref:Choice-of-anchor D domain-containing protein n=1 Tax=Aquella oligotrophica TaxID=2067065 RepID=A0A2I7N8J9_9NEIS|nr:hypothetical protein [Aquella oligotrophica]AUR52783.1 hypothetical protein CUN60_10930 [Aquella oligotrophica]
MQNRKRIMLLLMASSMLGCSQGGGANSSNSTPQPAPLTKEQAVSIDAMTTVPSLNGSSTKGVLYIHNYGTTLIDNLTFNVRNSSTTKQTKANSKIKQANQLAQKSAKKSLAANDVQNQLSLNDTSKCTSIPAGGYCTISFTTPVLEFADSGTSVVEMNYKQNGTMKKTHQLVNYAYVDASSKNSINLLGNTSVAMPQTKARHIVGYLYATGKPGTVFNNVEIAKSINYAGFKVVRGFVAKQQVTVGQIIPVEMELERQSNKPLSFQTYAKWDNGTVINKSALRADSVNTGNPASISIDPLSNQVSFIVGQAAIMQAPSTQDNIVNIINNGSADADSGIEVVAISGDSHTNLIIDNNCSNSHLAQGATDSCQVKFSVTDYNSGNALVEYRYKGEKIASQTIYWVNNKAVPSIKATPNTSSVTYDAASTPEEIVTYTIQNIGKAPLQSASYSARLSNASITDWEEVTNNCTTTINPGSSCQIERRFKPKSAHGIGNSFYTIAGSYNGKSYNFASLPIKYTINGEPLLSISASNNVMVLVADGVSTVSKTFSIKNDGNVKATNLSANLIDTSANDPKPVIDVNGCSSDLAKDASCEITVKYGPAPLDYNASQTGTATLELNYKGGTSDAERNAQKTTDYELTGHNSSVVVDDPSGENTNGSGTQADPFTTNSTVEGSKITIEYHNNTAVDMNNFNVNTNTIPSGYIISPEETTCATGTSVSDLNAHSSCKLVLIIDPATLADVPGATSEMDISFEKPQTSWKIDDKSFTQPGNGTIYVNYSQPQATFGAAQVGTSITLDLSIANSSLLPATANPKFVLDQFLTAAPTVSSGCTSTLEEDYGDGMGYYSVSCDLNQGSPQITLPMPDYLCDITIDNFLSVENAPAKTVMPAYFGFQYTAPQCSI